MFYNAKKKFSMPMSKSLMFDGAKLTVERVFDVEASSSSLPSNGAIKLVDGAVMMVPENLLAFVDEVKMTGQLETPREGLMNIAASFPSVMKPR
jgi:hypothetical protein